MEELLALQKKHREQAIRNRQKVEERKARTRRLIRRGGMLETFITGAAQMADDEIEAIFTVVFGREDDL